MLQPTYPKRLGNKEISLGDPDIPGKGKEKRFQEWVEVRWGWELEGSGLGDRWRGRTLKETTRKEVLSGSDKNPLQRNLQG